MTSFLTYTLHRILDADKTKGNEIDVTYSKHGSDDKSKQKFGIEIWKERLLWILRFRQEDTIKKDVKEAGCADMERIQLAQDMSNGGILWTQRYFGIYKRHGVS